jgi:hypothetical protein
MTIAFTDDQLWGVLGVLGFMFVAFGFMVGLVARAIRDQVAPKRDSDEALGAMFRDYLNTRRLIEDDDTDMR